MPLGSKPVAHRRRESFVLRYAAKPPPLNIKIVTWPERVDYLREPARKAIAAEPNISPGRLMRILRCGYRRAELLLLEERTTDAKNTEAE